MKSRKSSIFARKKDAYVYDQKMKMSFRTY
jgi:hypothetical protein